MAETAKKPQLVVIAGPNGAGKSTLTSQSYPELIANTVFINPDEIVKQVARTHPEKTNAQHQFIAGREALKAYETCFEQRTSFSLETTLAGNTPLKTMRKAQALDYHISLAFVGIESPQHSIGRVHERVQQGGHDIPIPDILRRYERSMENLPAAMQLADATLLFDNSQAKHRLILLLEKNGLVREVYQPDQPHWLKQRLTEPTLQVGQQLVFRNKQSIHQLGSAKHTLSELDKQISKATTKIAGLDKNIRKLKSSPAVQPIAEYEQLMQKRYQSRDKKQHKQLDKQLDDKALLLFKNKLLFEKIKQSKPKLSQLIQTRAEKVLARDKGRDRER